MQCCDNCDGVAGGREEERARKSKRENTQQQGPGSKRKKKDWAATRDDGFYGIKVWLTSRGCNGPNGTRAGARGCQEQDKRPAGPGSMTQLELSPGTGGEI